MLLKNAREIRNKVKMNAKRREKLFGSRKKTAPKKFSPLKWMVQWIKKFFWLQNKFSKRKNDASVCASVWSLCYLIFIVSISGLEFKCVKYFIKLSCWKSAMFCIHITVKLFDRWNAKKITEILRYERRAFGGNIWENYFAECMLKWHSTPNRQH